MSQPRSVSSIIPSLYTPHPLMLRPHCLSLGPVASGTFPDLRIWLGPIRHLQASLTCAPVPHGYIH